MPDPRFFDWAPPLSLGELARLAGAPAPLDGARLVRGAAPLDLAGPGDVAFFADRRYADALRGTRASVVLLAPDLAPDLAAAVPPGALAVVTATPQAAWGAVARRLHPLRDADAPGAPPELGEGVRLGVGVVLDPDVRIGSGSEIGAHAVLGPGVQVGRDCRIGAQAVLRCALVGDRVRIHSGAVIGEEGFGVTGEAAGLVDLPQLGRVILQDGVSVGANSCIDRGAYGDTVVGENTKIDNLVQVAHNVRLGRNCVLAAHTGLSGSVTVGDGAMFGGRAGVHDHVSVGAGAKIAAAAAVTRDVPAGETWAGQPARPLRRHLRETAWLMRRAREGRGEG